MKSKLNISLLTLSLVVISFSACRDSVAKKVLPVYGAKTAQGEDTLYHHIGAFELTNQYGEKITEQTVKGKLYVANFFFATCQSICPEMSTNLKDVQSAFFDDDSLLIVSHSVNPLHDTVDVLLQYANMYSAKKNKWHFLTGNKKTIYDLAKNDYLVNALEDDGTPEGFLHSELLLLIDGQGRIRGMYDGTDKAEVQKLIDAIKLLKTEKAS